MNKKFKKFCADNKEALILAGISVAGGAAIAILHNSLMKGMEIEHAVFSGNAEIDDRVFMDVTHKNGKTTTLVFHKDV